MIQLEDYGQEMLVMGQSAEPTLNIFGLGALTSEQVKDIGAKLAARSRSMFAMFTASDLAAALQPFGAADREQIVAVYLGQNGDPSLLASAQTKLDAAGDQKIRSTRKTIGTAWAILGTASFAVSVYHGYRRNDSLGWALVWGLIAGLFPIVTPVVALAQGFGKPKHA